jgi:hypothetical protein
VADENPCVADNERRERAQRDSSISEQFGDMVRSVQFQVGYDHMAFPEACGGGGHGRHGMSLRWVLSGPHGAVQWVLNMFNWIPGNVAYGMIENKGPWSAVPAHRTIGDGMAVDLGYHSPVPLWEGQGKQPSECDLLPEGYCYYDGSALNAEPVLEAFLAHGPHAVWASLGRYYSERFVNDA